MTTNTPRPAGSDAAAVYAVSCPPWCTGHHPGLLAMPAATLPDGLDAEADEAITHERALVPDETAGLGVDLAAVDVHPASQAAHQPAHLAIWIHGGPAGAATGPDQLRAWAAILAAAADQAEEWLS
jgi:hypothetical protein